MFAWASLTCCDMQTIISSFVSTSSSLTLVAGSSKKFAITYSNVSFSESNFNSSASRVASGVFSGSWSSSGEVADWTFSKSTTLFSVHLLVPFWHLCLWNHWQCLPLFLTLEETSQNLILCTCVDLISYGTMKKYFGQFDIAPFWCGAFPNNYKRFSKIQQCYLWVSLPVVQSKYV